MIGGTTTDNSNCQHCLCRMNTAGNFSCCKCGFSPLQSWIVQTSYIIGGKESLKNRILGILKLYGEFSAEHIADLIIREIEGR